MLALSVEVGYTAKTSRLEVGVLVRHIEKDNTINGKEFKPYDWKYGGSFSSIGVDLLIEVPEESISDLKSTVRNVIENNGDKLVEMLSKQGIMDMIERHNSAPAPKDAMKITIKPKDYAGVPDKLDLEQVLNTPYTIYNY